MTKETTNNTPNNTLTPEQIEEVRAVATEWELHDFNYGYALSFTEEELQYLTPDQQRQYREYVEFFEYLSARERYETECLIENIWYDIQTHECCGNPYACGGICNGLECDLCWELRKIEKEYKDKYGFPYGTYPMIEDPDEEERRKRREEEEKRKKWALPHQDLHEEFYRQRQDDIDTYNSIIKENLA